MEDDRAMLGLPRWVSRHLVTDDAFATAYGLQADWQLAALKTCLARLFVLHPPADCSLRHCYGVWRQEFSTRSSLAPRPWTLVAVDAALKAPARLLAALAPPLTGGVPRVLTVRIGPGDWPPALLAALELAGLETVLSLPEADGLDRLVLALEKTLGPGLILSLGEVAPPAGVRSEVWSPREAFCVAVWGEDDLPWDWRVLGYSQAGCRLTAYNAGRVPRGVARRRGDWPAFLRSGADMACVPEALAEEAAAVFPLVIAPGQEAVFAWPGFPHDFCRRHSLAILGAPS